MSFAETVAKAPETGSAARVLLACVWLTLLAPTGCGAGQGARPRAGGKIAAEARRLRGVVAAAGLPAAETLAAYRRPGAPPDLHEKAGRVLEGLLP